MHRFFAAERGAAEGLASLSAEDSRHAVRVLRLEPGDEIEIVAAPRRFLARIEQADEARVTARLVSELKSTEAKTRLTLYQGLPKADKMELIVQKCTELGVARVVPVAMERSVVRLEGKDAQKRAERWQKIAREAVKQCARAEVPEVSAPQRLAALKEELGALDLLIVPWEDARDGSLASCLASYAGKEALRVGILIGPEGGISAQEAAWLNKEAGGRLVTLGPRILRTETAGIAAVAVTMALRGEME
ncbi:MAG: 16S rRNA (uracil(1498)-N(3))-methyltransferase [Clostridia bacterium]|nr:16S rRNA (uracil(1498)-N(3))-methyltransferase [Clostridia bacterium]